MTYLRKGSGVAIVDIINALDEVKRARATLAYLDIALDAGDDAAMIEAAKAHGSLAKYYFDLTKGSNSTHS